MSADRAGLRRLMAEVVAARDAAIATGTGDMNNAEWVAFFAADDSLSLAAKVTLPGLLDLLDRCETALRWPAGQHCRGRWVPTDRSETIVEWEGFCPDEDCGHARARAVLAELRGGDPS